MAEKFVLGRQDLDHLIRGGEIRTNHGTCLILSDIGFDYIQHIANRAPHVASAVGEIRTVGSHKLDPIWFDKEGKNEDGN